jgi:hypothetical protein
MPSTRPQLNVRVDEALLDGLRQVQDRDGVPVSEQVRRAVWAWLEAKGVLAPVAPKTKTARKRVSPRSRA